MWQLILAPILSAVHLYCVQQEMRAAPINTLNSQRTAMLVADFVKVCNHVRIGFAFQIPFVFNRKGFADRGGFSIRRTRKNCH